MLLLGIGLTIDGLRKGLDLGERAMPGIAPLAFGTALAGPSALILGKSLRTWLKTRQESGKAILALSGMSHVRLPLVILLTLVLYASLMPLLGYLLTTFLFSLTVLWLLRRRGLKGLAAAIAITGGVYLLFLFTLRVPLPPGIFG